MFPVDARTGNTENNGSFGAGTTVASAENVNNAASITEIFLDDLYISPNPMFLNVLRIHITLMDSLYGRTEDMFYD